MRQLRAFFVGMIEFRSVFTSHYEDEILSYDRGRELAHVLTLRWWDK